MRIHALVAGVMVGVVVGSSLTGCSKKADDTALKGPEAGPTASSVTDTGSTTTGATTNPPVDTGQTDGGKGPTTKGKQDAKIGYTPPKRHHEGWDEADLGAAELAAKIDEAFSTLAGVESYAVIEMKIPTGDGQVKMTSKWKTPKVFDVQYADVVDGHSTMKTVRSDGTRYASIQVGKPTTSSDNKPQTSPTQPGWEKPVSLPSVQPANGNEVLKNWPAEVSKLAFGHYTLRKDVWSPLIAALMKSDSGFDVAVEKRATPLGNSSMVITDYRFLVTRKPAAEKKLGPCMFEMVVDGNKFVPVTIYVKDGHPETRKGIETNLAIKWLGNTFSKDDFKLPKSS